MMTHRARVTTVGAAVVTIGLLAGCSPEAPAPSESPIASSEATTASPPPSPSPTTSTPGVDPAEVAAARESLAEGISSGTTTALANWTTDPILVTIAASEFSELLTPYEAAAQAYYVVDVAATWNFALPDATIDQYRAGDYAAHFPDDVLVGRSTSGAVVAFAMTGAEASAMFLCIDEEFLL